MALQNVEPRLLELRIVIVVDDVEADDLAAIRQQALRDVKSDEAGGSGDQYRIDRTSFLRFSSQSRHSSMPAGLRAAIELHLDVENKARAIAQQPLNKRPAAIDIALVRDRQDDGVGRLERIKLSQRHAIFVLGVRGIRQRIVHLHRQAEGLQLADDIDHAGIAGIRNVLLERQAEHGHDAALRLSAATARARIRARRAGPCRR